jgi:hypothetical protein
MARIITGLFFGLMLALAPSAWAQAGRAQVTISATAALVKSHLMNEILPKGFTIISDTPNQVVFDRVSDNFAANLFFGTRYGGAPHYRLAFSLVEIAGSTNVYADIALVGNAGTAFERRQDFNQGSDLAAIQNLLNTVAMRAVPDGGGDMVAAAKEMMAREKPATLP